MVNRLIILAVLLVFGVAEMAHAQTRRQSGLNQVRERAVERQARTNPYWDGFILKHQGNCAEAITKLRPIASRGFGYEDAQTALGECYLDRAGLSGQGGTPPPRNRLVDNMDFKNGLIWIGKAANAGHFEAQAVMVNLYAVGLGPDEDRLEGSKWAHLYLTNPQRLNLGAPVQVDEALASLQAGMDKDSWLLGKERARIWVPVYSTPEKAKPEKAKSGATVRQR